MNSGLVQEWERKRLVTAGEVDDLRHIVPHILLPSLSPSSLPSRPGSQGKDIGTTPAPSAWVNTVR